MTQLVLTQTRPTTDIVSQPKNEKPKHFDFNRITDQQFNAAADHLQLDPDIRAVLSSPYRELIVQ